MDVGGSKGGSKRRRPTDTGAHLQHTQPAFQAAGPSQKGPNVAKSGQMWPKEAKVAENGQKLSKGVPRGLAVIGSIPACRLAPSPLCSPQHS